MFRIFSWLKGQIFPAWSDCVLFKASSLSVPELEDLKIEEVKPRQSPDQEQLAFLARSISPLRLWRLLGILRRGNRWIFFAKIGDEFCHYTFVKPGSSYSKMFPVIERGSVMIGPCLTSESFKGRRIYPTMLKHVVNSMASGGIERSYIYTHPSNTPSIRGIENAGFKKCGASKAKRYLFGACFAIRELDD